MYKKSPRDRVNTSQATVSLNITPRGGIGSYSKKNINVQIKESNPFRKSLNKETPTIKKMESKTKNSTPDRNLRSSGSKIGINPEERENIPYITPKDNK